MLTKTRRYLVIIIMISLISNCKVSSDFDIQGHRGCRGYYPENTGKGFLKAMEMGITTLEMDVVISADKQVLLSHEPFMNHEICLTPEGKEITELEEKSFNIYKMNYAEIVKFDCGSKTHPRFEQQEKAKEVKPLLSDVIQLIEKNKPDGVKIHYNIETKTEESTDSIFHPKPELFVDLVMQEIKNAGIEKQVIIQSFDVRTLQVLNQKYPKIKTALLIENTLTYNENIALLGFIPNVYSPEFISVDMDLAIACKKDDIKLIPWTVNEYSDIEKMILCGVDGIISDYPDRVLKVIEKQKYNFIESHFIKY